MCVRTGEASLVFGLNFLIFLERVAGNFFVIALEGSQVLTSLGEFTFLHTLTNVPVDESTLGVHEVELVVETVPGLGNGGGVGQHADGAVDGGQLAARNTHGLLVVDSELEASGAPFNEVEGSLGLDGGNGLATVTGNDVTAVKKSDSHVLSVAGIADNHLVVGLKALEGEVANLEALVRAAVGRDHGGVGDKRVVDTRVRHQVGLELVQINVKGTVEAERGGDGADDLGDQAVQVLVAGTGDIQVTTANVVDSFVVDQESAVGVLNSAVGGENGVVGLDDGSRDTGRWVDGELELALLGVVSSKTFEKKGTETGSSTTAERVEDQETLEGGAVVCIL